MSKRQKPQSASTPESSAPSDRNLDRPARGTVCVVGLGYIGLPTAAMLASRGFQVRGYDVNARAVAMINAGKPHFHEPDLQMLLAAAVQTGALAASTKPSAADYFIIAVPTPFKDGKQPDLSYVDAACDAVAPLLTSGNTVILESTSPVGTTEHMSARLAGLRADLRFPAYKDDESPSDIFLAHCPERVLPGQMLRELVANDRIIGGITGNCAARARALYESFVTSDMVVTDSRTAEFVKLVENSYRDVNIAFANELSLLAERFGIDVWEAIELANRHPRVAIMQPGPGVGGHCIAVDPWFLAAGAPDLTRLIVAARQVNDQKPEWVLKQIRSKAARLKKPVIACLGLSYKPDVDDMRESPAVEIVRSLAAGKDKLEIVVVEPNVATLPPSLAKCTNVTLVDAGTALRSADIVAVLVKHRQFKALKPQQFLDKMVVDTVGLLR